MSEEILGSEEFDSAPDHEDGDTADEQTSGGIPSVLVSPHPLGGIQVITRGRDGTTVRARIDIPEAAMLVAHLNTLITMAFQTMYFQHAMVQQEAEENAQKLYIPRS